MEPPLPTVSDPYALSREDLAAVAAVQRRENTRFNVRGSLLFIGGLALGVALLNLRPHMGWPEALDPVFFLSGWAIGLGGALPLYLRWRRALIALRLPCPHCGTALLGEPWRFGNNHTRADIVVASGVCVECGQRVTVEGAA